MLLGFILMMTHQKPLLASQVGKMATHLSKQSINCEIINVLYTYTQIFWAFIQNLRQMSGARCCRWSVLKRGLMTLALESLTCWHLE